MQVLADRTALVRAARCLLGAITRVLLLADIVVVKQLLLAKVKVKPSENAVLPSSLTDNYNIGFP